MAAEAADVAGAKAEEEEEDSAAEEAEADTEADVAAEAGVTTMAMMAAVGDTVVAVVVAAEEVAAEDTAATAVVAMREAGNSREDERRISPSSNVKGIWSESRKGICEVEKKNLHRLSMLKKKKKLMNATQCLQF